MICWQLFLAFLEIGAVSFGGGYGMISLIRELTLANGWLTEAELLNFIAVSESTPGPIAVNIATFVGTSQGGLPGALAATVGVVLPAFIIILIIAAAVRNLLQYRVAQAILFGIRPCVVGLVLAAAAIMGMSSLLGFGKVGDAFRPNGIAILIFFIIVACGYMYKRLRKKRISPILLILLSALLGGVLYSL